MYESYTSIFTLKCLIVQHDVVRLRSLKTTQNVTSLHLATSLAGMWTISTASTQSGLRPGHQCTPGFRLVIIDFSSHFVNSEFSREMSHNFICRMVDPEFPGWGTRRY